MLRVAVIAGESSGDQLGAALIEALRRRIEGIEFVGMVGPKMIAAGCNQIAHIDELSVMGLAEVLKQYPRLRRLRERLVRELLHADIDLLVGIDVPDFVLNIERRLKRRGIVTVHYVAPQVWAWRSKRAKKLATAADLLLTLFPFEPEFFSRYGVNAEFVGHPVVDKFPANIDRRANKIALGLDPEQRCVALLPGSRRQELQRHAALFREAAVRIAAETAELTFVVAAVDESARGFVERTFEDTDERLRFKSVVGRSHEVLAASDAALAVSGTVTMEAVCAQTPLVVAIRLAEVSYQVLKRMLEIPYIAMPNVLAGTQMVPEFIQHEATPANLAAAVTEWLSDGGKVMLYQQQCRLLRDSLSVPSDHDAAAAVLSLLSSMTGRREIANVDG